MVQQLNFRNLIILFPFAIIAVCIFAAKSTFFVENPGQLSLAITFDLLISAPVFYFLIIRKRSIPNTTVVPVFILGIVVASIILPTEHQFYLSLVKTWFLPLLEITIITYLIVTIRKAFKKVKQSQATTPDFFMAAKQGADSFLPKGVSAAFATELSLFYYGFLHWKSLKIEDNQFSYHKTTSTRMILGVFVFLIIIEAFAVHLLLQNYSTIAAWILTVLSIYGCFQVFGILRSLSKRPITLNNDALTLKYGVMGTVEIPLEKIQTVTPQTSSLDDVEGLVYLSPFKDMEGHNVVIKINEPRKLAGFYGFKKEFTSIALYLDDPKQFMNELSDKVG
ncbi:hypothetical protein [Ekhidna sp. To15]|uniref:hypothetical protein n=1 Tax=Ekhidna sp. To15 TaxID=3395267 RepID=UPI003F51FF77